MHIHRYMCMDLYYVHRYILRSAATAHAHTDTDTHADIPHHAGAHAREGRGPSYASIDARARLLDI